MKKKPDVPFETGQLVSTKLGPRNEVIMTTQKWGEREDDTDEIIMWPDDDDYVSCNQWGLVIEALESRGQHWVRVLFANVDAWVLGEKLRHIG